MDVEISFRDCCYLVLSYAKDPYAKAYAEAGLAMTDPEAVRTQALYVRTNLQHWRGDLARKVKAHLDHYGRSK